MVCAVTSKRALPRGVLCFIISLPHVYLKYWNSIPPVSSKEEGILPLHFPPAACLFQKTISLSRPETLFTGVLPLVLLIQLLWAFSRQQQQIYKLAWFIDCHSHSEGWVWSYPMNFSLVQPWKVMVGSRWTEKVCLQTREDDFAPHIWLEKYPCSPQTFLSTFWQLHEKKFSHTFVLNWVL